MLNTEAEKNFALYDRLFDGSWSIEYETDITKDMLWICCESFVIDIVNIWENLGQHVICTSRKRYNAKAKPLSSYHFVLLVMIVLTSKT